MFTGIVSDLGRVRGVEARGDTRFTFETADDTETIALGASIACSGVCLTVLDKGPGWFAAEASAETLARSTMGEWGPGTAVNLERALKLGEELGGHLVLGHVDGVATALERREAGDSLRLAFAAPEALRRFIAPKGSLALDGVSLTVNEVHEEPGDLRFEVNVIAHTARVTTLGACRPGARVNLEIDMLARYVQRLLAKD